MEAKRPPIFLYTDGAASGNPGPGGYGVVLRCGDHEKEMSEGFRLTTNNRMELLAVIKGLEAIKWENAEVHVWSDSSYVVKAINEGWLETWKRTGFAKKKNVDLWLRFDAVYRKHRVAFHWLKGHAAIRRTSAATPSPWPHTPTGTTCWKTSVILLKIKD